METMFRRTFLVLILVSISSVLCISINSIVIGRFLGSTAMSSYGLADPYFLLISSIGALFSIGTQVICAEQIAKGDTEKANQAFTVSFVTVISASLLITVIGIVFSGKIALFLSSGRTSVEGLAMLKVYLTGLFCSAPAFTGNLLLVPAMQLDGDTQRARNATILMSIVNVAIVTIGVIVLKQGMTAVAVGRMASYWTAFVVLMLHFRKKNCNLKLKFHDLNFSLLKGVMNVGVPKALRSFYDLFYKIILNKWILFLGAATLMSSISVQNSIHYLPDMLAVGLQGSVMMLVSVYIGESDRTSLLNLLQVTKRFFLIIIMPVSVLGVLLCYPLSHLFITDSSEVLRLASYAVAWYFGCLPFSAFNDCYIGYYQGLRNSRRVNTLMILGRIVIPLSMSLLLGAVFGPYGLISSLGISSIIMTAALIIFRSIKKGHLAYRLADLVDLPENLADQDHHIFYTTVRNTKEAAKVSSEIPETLRSYHLPEKQILAVSLCIEEMVRNITENKGKSTDPFIDISVTIDDKNVELHFRDNLSQYNFCEVIKKRLNSEDPSKNAQYRIVSSMTSDVRYIYLLDTNVMTLKIKNQDTVA